MGAAISGSDDENQPASDDQEEILLPSNDIVENEMVCGIFPFSILFHPPTVLVYNVCSHVHVGY